MEQQHTLPSLTRLLALCQHRVSICIGDGGSRYVVVFNSLVSRFGRLKTVACAELERSVGIIHTPLNNGLEHQA